jgi:hypothetical protein
VRGRVYPRGPSSAGRSCRLCSWARRLGRAGAPRAAGGRCRERLRDLGRRLLPFAMAVQTGAAWHGGGRAAGAERYCSYPFGRPGKAIGEPWGPAPRGWWWNPGGPPCGPMAHSGGGPWKPGGGPQWWSGFRSQALAALDPLAGSTPSVMGPGGGRADHCMTLCCSFDMVMQSQCTTSPIVSPIAMATNM